MKFNDVRDMVLSEAIRCRELVKSLSSSVLHTKDGGKNTTRGLGRGESEDR